MFFASSFISIGMTMACHKGAQASDHVNYSGIHNDHGFNPAPLIPLLGFIKTGRKHPQVDVPPTENIPPVYTDVPPEVIIPPTNNTVPPVITIPPEENTPPSVIIPPPVDNTPSPPNKTIPKVPPTKHNKPPVKSPVNHNKPPAKQHHYPPKKKPNIPFKPVPPSISKGELPKTGGIGSGLFYALGIGIASIGLLLMKGKDDEEVETTGP
jgi:LPXTG-motif cell wall-anchored protein